MSTPAPALTAIRVLGITAVAVAVLLGGLSVATSFARASTTDSFTAADVTRVEVSVDSGRIDLESSAASAVSVDVTAEGTWTTPDLERQQDGDTLRLSATCGPTVGINRCGATYRIEVPDGVDVDLRASAGQVRVDGIDGDLRARIDAGDVQMTDLRSSRVDVVSDVGRVAAAFAEAPTDVRVVAGAGSVELLLPRDGAPYAVDATADVGAASIDVPTDPDSRRTVVARTSVGAVEIRGQ